MVILDPTIVFEASHSLQKASNARTIKYSPPIGNVRESFGVTDVEVHGFAIGTRGVWCQQNTTTLQVLDKGFRSHLCCLALKGTINSQGCSWTCERSWGGCATGHHNSRYNGSSLQHFAVEVDVKMFYIVRLRSRVHAAC